MKIQPLNPQTEELKLAVAILFAVHGLNKGEQVKTTEIVEHIKTRYSITDADIEECINKLFRLGILTKHIDTSAPDFKEVASWTIPFGPNGQGQL